MDLEWDYRASLKPQSELICRYKFYYLHFALAFIHLLTSGKQRAKSLNWTILFSCNLYKTLFLTVETDCDITFSNQLIFWKTASVNSTLIALLVLRTFRVKAHVTPNDLVSHVSSQNEAGHRSSSHDTTSDRMREEELFFFIHNYWFEFPT